jgi:hypothetical protein
VYARGPIAVTIAVTAALESWNGQGVFNDTTGAMVGEAGSRGAQPRGYPATCSWPCGRA